MKLLLILLFSLTSFAHVKPIKIAIIDTGLNLKDKRFQKHLCKTGHKDFTNEGLNDTNGHGTHVAGLIQKYAGDGRYCFLIYKTYLENDSSGNLKREIDAIKEAITNSSDIINISAGGPQKSEEEYVVITSHPNTKFIVAAGNNRTDLDKHCNYYLACYKTTNAISVGSVNTDGKKSYFSNYGRSVKAWEIGENMMSTLPDNKYGSMNGTSQATGVHTGKMIKKMLNK